MWFNWSQRAAWEQNAPQAPRVNILSQCCLHLSLSPGPTFPLFPSFKWSIHCSSLSFPQPHNNFLPLSTSEKRRQTTAESRLTGSCCQNASIRHMYISVRKSERTHVYTHAHTNTNTQVKTTVSHLVVSSRHQPILSATTLENTQHTLIYLILATSDFFPPSSRLAFQLSSKLLWHFT